MRRLICGPLLAFFLAQCATVTRGPTQRIDVDSEPAGASVQLVDCGVGSTATAKTPATVFVNRRATRCTMTLTLPEYGSRSVSLRRREWAITTAAPPDELFNVIDESALGDFVVAASLAVWGIGRGIDAMTGSRWEQDRTDIFVDFTRAHPRIAGRYSLVRMNGFGLPGAISVRDGSCEIRTSGGSLEIDESGRWQLTLIEERSCGRRNRKPTSRVSEGVILFSGERILFESEEAVSDATLSDGRLELTVIRNDAQSVVYMFELM